MEKFLEYITFVIFAVVIVFFIYYSSIFTKAMKKPKLKREKYKRKRIRTRTYYPIKHVYLITAIFLIAMVYSYFV